MTSKRRPIAFSRTMTVRNPEFSRVDVDQSLRCCFAEFNDLKGGGLVAYQWLNRATNEVEAKRTCIKRSGK